MIFYTQTNDKSKLIEQCNILKQNTKQTLSLQKQKRKILRQCLDKVCYTIETIVDINNVNILFTILENLKASISASDSNINEIIHLQKSLKDLENIINICTDDSSDFMYREIDNFNTNYSSIEEFIIKNTNIIDEFLLYFIQNCNFNIENSITQIPNNFSEDTSNSEFNISDDSPKKMENTLVASNTLLISEKTQKVYLPYNIEDVLEKFNNQPNTYNNLEDVISKEYTLPLSKYKNPMSSRFKESFSLMKYKEHASFFKSFNLALELSHNSLLNPAIITACKNLDELNAYLDCLHSNELDKFTFFNIVFEILPAQT